MIWPSHGLAPFDCLRSAVLIILDGLELLWALLDTNSVPIH